jgi:hypothetical protein
VSYTVANVAVTIAQVYLLALVTYYFAEGKQTRLLGTYEEYSAAEVAFMFCFTLGGQILFLVTERGLI